jgi:hypothetical protein
MRRFQKLFTTSARNGVSEVPLCFLKAKQGYTVRKMEADKWIWYTLVSTGMNFRSKNKFRYGIPVFAAPFPALLKREHYLSLHYF